MGSTDYNIYSIESMPLEDYIELFMIGILPGVRCSQIDSAIIEYVSENIEPVGWRAIWRSVPKSSGLKFPHDFLVEVADVSQTKLEARVMIHESLRKSDDLLTDSKAKEFLNFTAANTILIPLLELYPLVDEENDGLFERTAEILSHVRFFYKNLWRPWDYEDEEDCVFVDCYLEPRLKVYFQILDKVIPNSIADQMNFILNEAWENYYRLQELEKDMQISDSENELNDHDVCKCMELRWKQDELKKELHVLENPTLRTLVIQKELSIKPFPHGKRQGDEKVLHIVADKLLAEMCQNLPPSTIIEHHTSFSICVSSAYEGDTIWIYPGRYICEGLGWLEDSIQIEGKGSLPSDVVIEAKSNSDIFLNCNAEHVQMKNFTIEAVDGQHCAVMVHRGHTTLKNCVIKHSDVGICVNTNSDVTAENCLIFGTKITGVNINSMGSAVITETVLEDFHNCGIAVKIEENCASAAGYSIRLSKNTFVGSGTCGIALYKSDKNLQLLKNFQALTDLAGRFEQIVISNNEFKLQGLEVCIEN